MPSMPSTPSHFATLKLLFAATAIGWFAVAAPAPAVEKKKEEPKEEPPKEETKKETAGGGGGVVLFAGGTDWAMVRPSI